jgi:hypothetical protein
MDDNQMRRLEARHLGFEKICLSETQIECGEWTKLMSPGQTSD